MVANGVKSDASRINGGPPSLPANVNSDIANGYDQTNTTDDNVVLLNTFVIWKKRYRVFYHSSMLVWEKNESKSGKLTINDIHNLWCLFWFVWRRVRGIPSI